MVARCKQVAELAAGDGVDAEVLILRWLKPFDVDALATSGGLEDEYVPNPGMVGERRRPRGAQPAPRRGAGHESAVELPSPQTGTVVRVHGGAGDVVVKLGETQKVEDVMGRHSDHLVEGTDPQLNIALHEPATESALCPVLLLHGFASSAKLNWEDSGWVRALTDAGRKVITVDLPGHGASAAPEEMDAYSPSRIRADLLQILQDAHVVPLTADKPASGVDIIGYSLGARLAWEFGATQPEMVRRMVLGGPGSGDPLAEFDLAAAQRFLTDGTPIDDESTAGLLTMARLVPTNDVFALLTMVEAIRREPFVPSDAVPQMPLLLVAGDADERARTLPELAQLSTQAEVLWLPGRTHTNAVTSRTFKSAAIEFLAA